MSTHSSKTISHLKVSHIFRLKKTGMRFRIKKCYSVYIGQIDDIYEEGESVLCKLYLFS